MKSKNAKRRKSYRTCISDHACSTTGSRSALSRPAGSTVRWDVSVGKPLDIVEVSAASVAAVERAAIHSMIARIAAPSPTGSKAATTSRSAMRTPGMAYGASTAGGKRSTRGPICPCRTGYWPHARSPERGEPARRWGCPGEPERLGDLHVDQPITAVGCRARATTGHAGGPPSVQGTRSHIRHLPSRQRRWPTLWVVEADPIRPSLSAVSGVSGVSGFSSPLTRAYPSPK